MKTVILINCLNNYQLIVCWSLRVWWYFWTIEMFKLCVFIGVMCSSWSPSSSPVYQQEAVLRPLDNVPLVLLRLRWCLGCISRELLELESDSRSWRVRWRATCPEVFHLTDHHLSHTASVSSGWSTSVQLLLLLLYVSLTFFRFLCCLLGSKLDCWISSSYRPGAAWEDAGLN